MEQLRGFFRIFNRFFMVPIFRLGLGALTANPLSGYIMVMKMTGWKTGKTRFVPVNYAIDAGRIFCLAGWGNKSHWYRNLAKNPTLDAILPGGTVHGEAEEISDPVERLRMSRKIMRAAGFVAFLDGLNPFSCSDEKLAQAVKDSALFRIRPIGLGCGPADPGDWAWVWIWLVSILLGAWLILSAIL